MIVKTMPTEPKVSIFSGVIPEHSLTRFKVSMATFGGEKTLFRRLGCGVFGITLVHDPLNGGK